MKVLIAEDDRASQVRLVAYLKEWGYEGVVGNDGEEAWEHFQVEDFRIVICDWIMPKLDGIELIRRIRAARRPHYIYILLLTGKAEKADRIKALEAGAQDFMLKPLDKDELRVRLLGAERVLNLVEHLASHNRELENFNKELERSNQALRSFTSLVSHDLQEPLRTISGFIKLLQGRMQQHLDERTTEYMDFVTDGTSRMQTLITDLLQYSKLRTGEQKLVLVDCQELFQTAVADLDAAINGCGASVTCGELPSIHGDRTQLRMLFQNLIGNAIKYQAGSQPEVHVDAKLQAGEWLFSVRDNGIGIEAKYLEDIFEPFRRLHTKQEYSGTGIGLACCQQVAEQHGGRIWVESEVATGSKFYFT